MSKPNRPTGSQGRRNKTPDGKQPIDATAVSASAVSAPTETASAPAVTVSASVDSVPAPAKTVSTAPPKIVAAAPPRIVPAPAKTVPAPANTFSSGIQTIAAAYSDYTKKSFEDTKCFVEKLANVRSFDKAVEVQIEYAKATYVTFAAESQKIRQLYSDLAKQTFKPFEASIAKATQAAP
jgi:hypothetical protein